MLNVLSLLLVLFLILPFCFLLAIRYVGVVCRNQKDINNKIEIRNAFREEERFFRTHPVFRTIAHRCGTQHLAVVLNQVFTSLSVQAYCSTLNFSPVWFFLGGLFMMVVIHGYPFFEP